MRGAKSTESAMDRQGGYLIHVLSAATFLFFLQAYAVAPLIPKLTSVFHVSIQTIGITVPMYMTPYGAAALLYSILSDCVGRHPIILGSLALFALFTVLTALAQSAGESTFRRLLPGVGRDQRKSWIILLLLFVCAGLPSPTLRAQAIIAPGGRTLFSRESLVRSFLEARHLSLRTPDGTIVDLTQYVTSLAFVYGFHPKWMLIVAAPYVTADITTRTRNTTMRRDLNGFADSQLFLQYDGLYSRNAPGGLTRLSGVFGLQVPTGAQRFSAGAVQYTGGLIFEKVTNLKYAFTGDFEYTVATENEDRITSGNHVVFDVVPAYFIIARRGISAGTDRLRNAFDQAFRKGAYATLEFNGTWQAHAFARGSRIANTGGTTLSISPGIQYFLGRRFLLEFSAPIHALKNLNGMQPRPESTFLLGFRWLF